MRENERESLQAFVPAISRTQFPRRLQTIVGCHLPPGATAAGSHEWCNALFPPQGLKGPVHLLRRQGTAFEVTPLQEATQEFFTPHTAAQDQAGPFPVQVPTVFATNPVVGNR